MKKSFRRALACLLAVLMVAFSMPFSAFADDVVGGDLPTGWWGDNNYDATTNESIPHGEQSYDGWNSDSYDLGLSWADAVSMESDLEMGSDAKDMMGNYKPVLTVTVSDQGDADNRIYREYYGYSQAYDYDTVKAAGHLMNPADLHAGDRIAVTFEIGGFDMLYSGQLKGMIDTDYLAFAYYKLNPKSKDQWAKCSDSQKTQAFITRGYSFYGDAASDGGAMNADPTTGQFYIPYICNVTPPASAYVGADQRPYGKNGMVICTLSFEVLQDCDLKNVIDLTKDKDNSKTYLVTQFAPYDKDQMGGSSRKFFTFDKEDNNWTYGLIALDYSEYDKKAGPDPVKHEHHYTQVKTPATCTEDGKITYTCSNEDGLCDNPEYTVDDPEAKALGHDYESPQCEITPNNNGTSHTVKCVRYEECQTSTEVTCTSVPNTEKNKDATSCEPNGGGWADATKCQVCGQELNPGHATDPKAHTPTPDTEKNKPATCETPGWENATKCQVCGTQIDAGNEIPALHHEYTGEVIQGTDGEHHQVKCTRYDQCKSTQEVSCSWQQSDAGYDATYDAPGKAPTFQCQQCGQTKGGEVIPALKGYEVTVVHKDLGTSEINGTPVTKEDVTLNVKPDTEITLVAKPNEGVKFVGWMVNSTIVSTEETFKPQVIANTTYEPVFQEDDESAAFTVVFTDMYGNIFDTQTVNSGSEIKVPEGPVIAGYTFKGWSMTNEDIAALSSAATIQAKYDRIVENTYTVTATGATITTPYSSTTDKNTGIGYDTKVTVHADGATVWKIDDAIVGYGDTYTFYVGSDVELTFEKGVVTETPVVAAVSTSKIGTEGKYKASFLASRKLVDGYTYVNAGFIYGIDVEKAVDELTLADVNQKTIRAYYCATDSEQFALNVGRIEQTGKISARAFLAYTEGDGEDGTKIVYATFDDFSY